MYPAMLMIHATNLGAEDVVLHVWRRAKSQGHREGAHDATPEAHAASRLLQQVANLRNVPLGRNKFRF